MSRPVVNVPWNDHDDLGIALTLLRKRARRERTSCVHGRNHHDCGHCVEVERIWVREKLRTHEFCTHKKATRVRCLHGVLRAECVPCGEVQDVYDRDKLRQRERRHRVTR